MVERYSDKITISTVTDSVQNSDGDLSSSSAGAPVVLKCRAESSGGNGYLTGTDGKLINYSWVVYMPSGAPLIKAGSQVSIINKYSETICTDTVKRFSRGQMNCRLWL